VPAMEQLDPVGRVAEPLLRFESEDGVVQLPFELLGNLILLRARVNDSPPLTFILDTGAETSVLDIQRARALRLKPDRRIVGTGGAGRAEATFTNGVSLTLPGLQVRNLTLYVLPLSSLSAIGRDIDGVIGNDIIRRCVVEIDYAGLVVRFVEPRRYRYSGSGTILTLAMEGQLPFVRASVTPEGGRDSLEADLELDTGSTGSVLFNTPFVEKHQLLAALSNRGTTSLGGVGGRAETIIGPRPEHRPWTHCHRPADCALLEKYTR
jgi:hypothetical protein